MSLTVGIGAQGKSAMRAFLASEPKLGWPMAEAGAPCYVASHGGVDLGTGSVGSVGMSTFASVAEPGPENTCANVMRQLPLGASDGYYGTFAGGLFLGANFTLATWMKTTTGGGLLAIGITGQGVSLAVSRTTGQLTAHWDTTTVATLTDSSGPDLRDGAWHHVALGVTGFVTSTATLYLDGVERATGILSPGTDMSTNIGLLGIEGYVSKGTWQRLAGTLFSGTFAYAGIWPRHLSADEIRMLA